MLAKMPTLEEGRKTIGVVQMTSTPRKEENLQQSFAFIKRAKLKGAEVGLFIVVLMLSCTM